MTDMAASVARAAVGEYGSNFEALAESVRRTWANTVAAYGGRVFRVTPKLGSGNMNDAYLSGFVDAAERQHHTCAACSGFLRKFGALAVVTDDGSLRSALWDANDASIPAEYKLAVTQMSTAVRLGKVLSAFYSAVPHLTGDDLGMHVGEDSNGFTHFTVPRGTVGQFTDMLKTPGQMMADSQNHFYTFTRALGEFDRDKVARAVTLLTNGGLARAETVLPPARWMLQVHDTLEAMNSGTFRSDVIMRERANNILWREIHNKSPGWLTPRSGLLGTLLIDIAAGKSEAAIKRAFGEKVEPTQYRRAQVAPRVGNVAAGEAIVARLGLAPSFERRYADLHECELLWEPAPRRIPGAPARSGVFAGLPTHSGTPLADAPPLRDRAPEAITWARFLRTIVPEAQQISVKLDPRVTEMAAVITAVNPDAPPIIAWDPIEPGKPRNQFSWYTYPRGSRPEQWGLHGGVWLPVRGLGLMPCNWTTAVGRSPANFGNIALAYVEGAMDQSTPGLGLFDEVLRPELHQIRATLESYSNRGQLQNRQVGNACGIFLAQNSGLHVLRVKTASGYAFYRVDRWD